MKKSESQDLSDTEKKEADTMKLLPIGSQRACYELNT